MAENTKIEWCHHTFNPWIGCQAVSPACDHCYAETLNKRTGGNNFGPKAERRRTSVQNWNLPRRWNKQAAEQGIRYRVFCASMADVFDNQVPAEWRADLFLLIATTPHLDWMLLTKRPENMRKMLPEMWGDGWPNVWLGVTVEDQKAADHRIPILRDTPAAIRFISYEPALGPVNFARWMLWKAEAGGRDIGLWQPGTPVLDLIICGGESGPGARPMHPEWARSVRDQCEQTTTAFFFKQWGDWRPIDGPKWSPITADRQASDSWMTRDGQIVPCGSDRAKFYSPYGDYLFRRMGKKAAGRLLDGRTHDEMPGMNLI